MPTGVDRAVAAVCVSSPVRYALVNFALMTHERMEKFKNKIADDDGDGKLDWSELGARISSAKFSGSPRRLERILLSPFALRAKVPLCEPVLFPAMAMPTACPIP